MIKKYFIILYFCFLSIIGFSQPSVKNLIFPTSVDVYGLYEVRFQLDEYSNPYDPEVIDVYAVFTGPDGRQRHVIGFFCEGYSFIKEKNYERSSRDRDGDGWRVRFTPDLAGQWTFTLHINDQNTKAMVTTSKGAALAFECRPKDAKGFISLANTQYLKRDVIENGQPATQSFYPIGPNVAWYDAADNGYYKKPYGIYEYENYLKRLSGKANYLRLWINRYQYLSLYGSEHAGTIDGKTRMYFDNTLNQKDAAELDHIIQNAQENDISLMVSVFNFGDFIHKKGVADGSPQKPSMPSDWINNPYRKVLGLESKYDFFTDERAIQITKNLFRYIVARWGYATNILCWELWNELANMAEGEDLSPEIQRDMVQWNLQMAEYIRSIDPYHHLISTSLGSGRDLSTLWESFDDLDFVQDHNYQNIQKCVSNEQLSYVLYQVTNEHLALQKPFFMGEFGFGQTDPKLKYSIKDPKGIDMHNSIWSSAFSGSMGPASFWYWEELNKNNWYDQFKSLKTFFDPLPVLSDNFNGMTTGIPKKSALDFPNGLETYYLINENCDTILGWSQDTAFCYQSLRRLTDRMGKNNHFIDEEVFDPEGYVYTLDPAKRPGPSSTSNSITLPISGQPRGTRYLIRWFDAETGLELVDEATTVTVRRPLFRNKRLTIEFPSSIRNLESGTINNMLGDAVFMITKISD